MAPERPIRNTTDRRKSDQTRDRILTAARNAFARKGFSGTTIADITGPANVTRANFYYYFSDKQQLFIELGTATYLEVLGVVESFSDLTSPANRADISAWLDRYFEYLDRNGAFVIRSSEDGPADRRFRATAARSHRRTAQALGERIAKIAADPPDVDPHAMGLAIMTMLEHTWLLTRGSGGLTETAAKDALCEMIYRAVR
jgi:AcrR family transcriptional regulator